MGDQLETIRKAFDGDSAADKNIALRLAHDEIERLRSERHADAQALKTLRQEITSALQSHAAEIRRLETLLDGAAPHEQHKAGKSE